MEEKGYPPAGTGGPPPYQGAPYPPAGEAPSYPPAGGAPYPPAGGAYPPAGAAPPPYYPGAAPYPQQGTAPPNTVIIQAPPLRFGESPVPMRCSYCHADIVTGTRSENGLGVWLVAGVCCFTGLWLGCCLIPFCISSLKDVVHTCPNCQRQIGKYQRIS